MKDTITTNPNYTATPSTQKTKSVFKNIVLDGVKTLSGEKITSQGVEPISFDLIEVSPEELAKYRDDGIPSFVLKVDSKLYYTSIPRNISFIDSNILGTHQCAIAGRECNRLSAACDEDGGCEKVREQHKRIEEYSFITMGYQTFNTIHDFLKVVECSHYEPCMPRKKPSVERLNRLKLSIAQFILGDDVDSREKVIKRVSDNQAKNNDMYKKG